MRAAGWVGMLVVWAFMVWGVAAQRPNILFILIDDLGFGDLGEQGSTQVETPNIDRIAENGAKWTDTYSQAAFCSPSRAGIMTGRHPSTFGHIYNAPHSREDGLMGTPRDLTLMPQTLKTVGYRTMIIGKWHLGFFSWFHPLKRGFDFFFGFLGGRFPYFEAVFPHPRYLIDEYIYDQWKRKSSVQYLTVEFTNAAISFINQSVAAAKPFFLYLSYNAPHGPYECLPEDLAAVDPTIQPPLRRRHICMIKRLDIEIGRVLDRLEALGQLDNTFVVFTNDNGGHPQGAFNGELRDFKNSWFEGGLRVPMYMMWNNRIRPGQVIPHPVTLMDLYPTFEMAGLVGGANRNPDLQGRNLLPHMTRVGEISPRRSGPVHPHIVMGSLEEGMVRQGKWKLYVNRTLPTNDVFLFNLDTDIGETTDVSSRRAPKRQELMQIFNQWRNQNPPPVFPEDNEPNPLSVSMTGPGSRFRLERNRNYFFRGTGSDVNGNSFRYTWESFRTGNRDRANFNVLRAGSVRLSLNAARRFATVRFTATGRFTIRVNVDNGRFWKWADYDVVVV